MKSSLKLNAANYFINGLQFRLLLGRLLWPLSFDIRLSMAGVVINRTRNHHCLIFITVCGAAEQDD